MQTIAFLDLFSEIELLELVESLKLIEGDTLLLPPNRVFFLGLLALKKRGRVESLVVQDH